VLTKTPKHRQRRLRPSQRKPRSKMPKMLKLKIKNQLPQRQEQTTNLQTMKMTIRNSTMVTSKRPRITQMLISQRI
jgi:hypothetical protein